MTLIPSDISCVAVVDDDESVCRSLGRLLRAAGLQSITYLSAEAFLADDKRPGFDCFIFDIQLGGISGIELAQRLASAGSLTPVIFITAHDEPNVREQAQRIPCFAFLQKTEPAGAVLAAIHQSIDQGRRLAT